MATHKSQTILLLEPDVLLRMALGEYLRECGYHVIEGVKPEDVWTVIRAGVHLYAVFARVQRGGFALAAKVRQTHPKTNVILHSGIADAVKKAAGLCDRGPVKGPHRPESVARRIQRLVAGRERSLTRKGA